MGRFSPCSSFAGRQCQGVHVRPYGHRIGLALVAYDGLLLLVSASHARYYL